MDQMVAVVARSSATRLAAATGRQQLPIEVERQLDQGGDAPDSYEPIALSIAGLVISAAPLAWKIYTDLRDRGAEPEPRVVERKVRLELEVPSEVDREQVVQVVSVVVEETIGAASQTDQ